MMKNSEKFREFVNENVGTELTTGLISRRSGIHIRIVQSLCKKVRETTSKVKYKTEPTGSIVYKFKRLTKQDI